MESLPRCRGRLLVVLAALPFAAAALTASAENRKFVVFLADLSKDHPGSTVPLPNRTDITDEYFDKVKNGQNGIWVQSFAEWWEEVSYGDVTVDGKVTGWFRVPWPSRAEGLSPGTFSSAVISHYELQGGYTYEPGQGEFPSALARFQYDFDGAGEDTFTGNQPAVDVIGFLGFDDLGNFIWTPGERFQDLNGNGDYDAGVPEMGIDKNGNGIIDVDRKASSWSELFGAVIDYGPPDNRLENPIIKQWANNTEWFDSNRDGTWNGDGTAFPRGGAFLDEIGFVVYWWGDWGGTEPWIDRAQPGELGAKAEPAENAPEGTPATMADFMKQVFDPEDDSVEWWDENNNAETPGSYDGGYDYPEPFEDFMRRWSSSAHDFVPTSDTYILDNYPADANRLIARRGNHRYDSPDGWDNNGSIQSSNKGQRVEGLLLDANERAEQIARDSNTSRSYKSSNGVPPWWDTFWFEYFGTQAPSYQFQIPYIRKFDPATPIPQLASQATQPEIKFEPNGGGPLNDGKPFRNSSFSGTVLPDIKSADYGMYDGPAEYADLPSSIYHSGGDNDLGEITSPANSAVWGESRGAGDPNSPSNDSQIEPAGPLAFNVHGDNGWDAGCQLNTEFLTWRTNGTSLADEELDFGGFVFRLYRRDINLDGMIDLGETPGVGTANYAIDPYNSTNPANGGPQGAYPWNRLRLMEDCAAAMDDSLDFREFLGGPGAFGNNINGVILVPSGTGEGCFFLPAPGFGQEILLRDGLNADAYPRRDQYQPVRFFNGLGISLGDTGEGGRFRVGGYHTPFSAHEYCHSWEGYPDLYDYDVYQNSGGENINHPIGLWCVMSGGGLVHPVPILKEDSGWTRVVDIENALTPFQDTNVDLRTWELDRDKTVFRYTNPLYTSESFYLWRQNPTAIHPVTGEEKLTFDAFLPGKGVMILHVDRRGNPDGLPQQQRLGGHFTYLIVQADGLDQLEEENGPNEGDDGDPFPGSTNKRQWDRMTDPSNRWYDGQGSGLDVVNIEEQPFSTRMTIRWTPRDVPSFRWVEPMSNASVNGIYTLKYYAYDQRGGTTLKFFADSDSAGYDGVFLGSTTKQLGDVDGTYQANIGGLPNGTYQFYVKLEPGPTENRVSAVRPGINNQGDGTLTITNADINLDVSRLEVWTVRCENAAVRNKEQWSVTGSVSGRQKTLAVTGTQYLADTVEAADGQFKVPLKLMIDGGGKRFKTGDQFVFVTTGFTAYSKAVLIVDGNVTQPKPPVAVIDSATPADGVAGWTTFQFVSGSSDPLGAEFTEVWSFGDGQNSPVQDLVPSTVTHKYTAAGDYTVTLTVTNAFDLTSTANATVRVRDANAPKAVLAVNPRSGRAPLQMTVDGSQSVDQNDPALGGSNLTYRWTLGSGVVLDPVAGTPNNAEVVVKPGPPQGPFDVIVSKPGATTINLQVTNGFGKNSTASTDIQVIGPPADKPPTAAVSASPRSGAGPLTVRFDGTGSFDPEGSLLEFSWKFGDNSAVVTGVSVVEHTYSRAGSYNATLTVTDASGLTDDATVNINVSSDSRTRNGSPVAQIAVSAIQGAAPFTVDFDATGSIDPDGDPMFYAWDFDDGSGAVSGPIVSHTFTQARQYSVVLVVRDDHGGEGVARTVINVTLAGTDSGRDVPSADGGGGTNNPQQSGCGLFSFLPIMLTLAGMAALRRRYGGRSTR